MKEQTGYTRLARAVSRTGEENKRRTHSNNQYTTTNQTHTEMKHMAKSLLAKNFPDFNVYEEYRLQLTRQYVMDVVAIKESKIIVVECGDINSDKQSDFWDFFSDENKAELYWLPFNAGKLFRIIPVEDEEQQLLQFKKYSKAHK